MTSNHHPFARCPPPEAGWASQSTCRWSIEFSAIPLAASDAQVATLLKLHKQGKSLRAIVANTLLSLRAAGIIIDRGPSVDRTST